jgi:hypothetical protein
MRLAFVLLVILATSSVLAVGLIPPTNSFQVDENDVEYYDLMINGGPEAQTVTFFAKSLEPDRLLIRGRELWENSVNLAPAEVKKVQIRLDGIRDDNSVTVQWGVKVFPANQSGSMGFEQITQDSFTVKVNNVVSQPVDDDPPSSSSGGSGGGSSSRRVVVANNTFVNASNGSISALAELPGENINEPINPSMQDLTAGTTSLTQGVVDTSSTQPGFAVNQNVKVTDQLLDRDIAYKAIFGTIFTVFLLLFGTLIIALSINLRSNVYK